MNRKTQLDLFGGARQTQKRGIKMMRKAELVPELVPVVFELKTGALIPPTDQWYEDWGWWK